MDANLKLDLTLKITDGLDVKLSVAAPIQAGSVKDLRESVREHAELLADSVMDALQKQMDATLAAPGSLWANR